MTCGSLATAIAAFCMFLQPMDEEKERERKPELNGLNPAAVKRDAEGWTCLRAVADTGAERSAISRQACPDREVLPSESSKQGRNFSGADGSEIINEGEQFLPTVSPEGVWTVQRWNVAETSRPLLAITEECDKGQIAVFGSGGGVLFNLKTHAIRHLPRVNGTYEAEMWVPSKAMEVAAASGASAGFTRRGW